MRRVIPLVVLSLLALVPFGNSSPSDGSSATRPEVGSAPWTTTRNFRGGERACVFAFGDHKPVVNLHLLVYEVKSGSLVAEDKANNSLVGDYVGVVWYPPRTGDYKIELRNPGAEVNKCYVAIK